jgi:DNA-binding HxlR family transcriptional regulator
MPLRQDWSEKACPIARSLDAVGDPWVVLILREALFGARRFEEFRDRLGVADNVLSRRLTQMVEDGLLRRSPYRGKQRMHEEYLLTDAGADLFPVLDSLRVWGETWTKAPRRHSKMSVAHGDHTSTKADVCTTCGAELTRDNREWRRRLVG